MKTGLLLLISLVLSACSTRELGTIQTAHLLAGDVEGFAAVKAEYEANNSGATIDWFPVVMTRFGRSMIASVSPATMRFPVTNVTTEDPKDDWS
jgi:hypothetical protein